MRPEKPGHIEPYKGLQPYEEENRDIFFGRDQEREILIDKIFSNKLTLLFAATGVGKSSLLQAAVMSELKRPERLNLDVVYYTDWVSSPLEGLKHKTIQILRERGKVGFDYQIDEGFSLKDFFQLCSTFSSEPLVIILDQFEEFFQNHQFKEDFIEEFSECINDRLMPVSFVISMREDFALELNAFKDYLPTTLFDNYFRLEKLTKEKAKDAIRRPVEKLEFLYEDILLEKLLKDLVEKEKETQLGKFSTHFMKEIPSYVDAPYLQIVCTQLWEEEKQNPGRYIRLKSYNNKGGVKGFVESYFNNVMTEFSSSEKKIASKAFNYLVTRRGTKIAYPLKDLSNIINVNEKTLENILEKLRKSRVLRSQKRKDEIWYELYHDIFANIIFKWSEKLKAMQRFKRTFFISAMAILSFLVFFIIFDVFRNSTNHYLRLGTKPGISDRIELYRGKLKSLDIFNLNKYEMETEYQRNQIEDKLFTEKQLEGYDKLYEEIISQLPKIKRISASWEIGEIYESLEKADKFILENSIVEQERIVNLLGKFGSRKSYERLKKLFSSYDAPYIRMKIIQSMVTMGYPSRIKNDLIGLLRDSSADVRVIAAEFLGGIGDKETIEYLLPLLRDEDPGVRRIAIEALGRIGSAKAIPALTSLFKNQQLDMKYSAAEALSRIDHEKAVTPMIALLTDQDPNVRCITAKALGQMKSLKAVGPMISLLNDQNSNVRRIAIEALGQIGNTRAIPLLVAMLEDQNSNVRRIAAETLSSFGGTQAVNSLIVQLKNKDPEMRSIATETLGQIDSTETIPPLISMLKDRNSNVRSIAAEALGRLGVTEAVTPLIVLLNDQDAEVQRIAAEALGQIGSAEAISPLIVLLKEKNPKLRRFAAKILGQIGGERVITPLISLLKDQDLKMRSTAAEALGEIASTEAIFPLIVLLKEIGSTAHLAYADILGLIDSTKSKDQYLDVVYNVSRALGRIGSNQAVIPLTELLKDLDPNVRRCAIEGLGDIGSVEAVQSLLNLLQDPYVRSNVVNALGDIGSDKAVPHLVILLKDQEENIRRTTASALGQIGSSEAVSALLKLQNDQESSILGTVAEALGEIGSEKAVRPLIELLNVQDYNVRRNTIVALGLLGNPEAISPLITFLNDQDPNVQQNVMKALERIGSPKLLKYFPISLYDQGVDVQRSFNHNLKKLSASEKADLIKSNYRNKPERPGASLAVAATLLEPGDEEQLVVLKEKIRNANVSKRINTAKILGEVTSTSGTSLLIEMLNDENILVKEKVILSLGKAKAVSSLPYLHKLIQEPNTSIREAVVNALSKIGSPESSKTLKKVVVNTGERMSTRKESINALAKIQHKDSLQALMELLNNENSIIQYKTIMAIGKNPPSQAIPDDLINQLKSRLNDKLEGLEKRKARWRKIRDENTEDYNQEQMDEWRSRLKQVEPNEPLEFELAFALSRIDPENEGINLLEHHLANVREGAWMGLGKSRSTSLIEKLYWKRKESKSPWFIHAAYRAIDHILINIDAFGGKEELNRLEALYKNLSEKEGKDFHEGVQTRMEWTIERLKERVVGH